MSLSRVLRGDEADAMSRWELPHVDGRAESDRQTRETEETQAEPEEEVRPRWPTAEELETIRRQAHDEGFAEGREAGHQEGHDKGYKAGEKEAKKLEQEQKKRLQTLEALIGAQAEPLAQLDDEVQEQMVRLVLTLSRQVIRRELQTQPGEILPVIREAVALLPMSARDVRVHVHPDDHRFLNELLGEDESGRAWRLVDDPSLSRGGCVVQAERSRVDATLERRLAQLASQLLGGREDDLVRDLTQSDAGTAQPRDAEGPGAPAEPQADAAEGVVSEDSAASEEVVDAQEPAGEEVDQGAAADDIPAEGEPDGDDDNAAPEEPREP